MLKQSQKIRAILFLEVLKINLYQVWKHANIEIHFTKKGLRDMLRMKDILEKKQPIKTEDNRYFFNVPA